TERERDAVDSIETSGNDEEAALPGGGGGLARVARRALRRGAGPQRSAQGPGGGEDRRRARAVLDRQGRAAERHRPQPAQEAERGGQGDGGQGEAMRQLLEALARELVEEPGRVRVEEWTEDGVVHLDLEVAPDDRGRVIGRQGRTADALRTLLDAVGRRRGIAGCMVVRDSWR